MRKCTSVAALAALLAGFALAAAQESKNDSRQALNDVLERVKQRAEQQRTTDRQQAMQLLEQARTARTAGRDTEAMRLAEKAEALFSESPAIQQLLQDLRGAERAARELHLNVNLARYRLQEAIEYADQSLRERKFALARDLAEAVRDSAGKFPQGVDVTKQIEAAERILREAPVAEPVAPAVPPAAGEKPMGESPPPREVLPPPEPVPPDPLKSPSEVRQMLAKRIHLEWRDAPLAQVLQDLANETGVRIEVDPDLLRSHVLDTRRVYLNSHGAAADRILRTVTDLTLSAYVLADGQVQILPKHKALSYTVARSREVPELGLRAVRDKPIRLADLSPGATAIPVAPAPGRVIEEPAPSMRNGNGKEVEKLPPPMSVQPEYLQSGRALRAEIERLYRVAEPRAEAIPKPKEEP